MDFDAHNADAWQLYGQQYLDTVKEGLTPYLKTAGSGTDSATTPLVAVGNTLCNSHNPPKFLNAEFNSVELKAGDGDWKAVRNGDVFTVKKGAKLMCRGSVGNTAEAAWLAPPAPAASATELAPGTVYLSCGAIGAPIASNTEYLKDAEVREFALPMPAGAEQKVAFTMLTARKKADSAEVMWLPFGEKWMITLKTED